MFELMTGFLVTGAALWLIHVAARNHSRKKRRQYAQFLRADRQTSTLEYVENVTRERRDARVWR